jgi:hypothetical protein
MEEIILLHINPLPGDSRTAFARKQLCGHVSLPTREHAIMEEIILLHINPLPGDSRTAFARKQLCGHVSLPRREHAIMEETSPVRSVPELYNEQEPAESGSKTS